ncbi:Co2+/Mg2+ efflux protein ApaG [Sphingobacterium corticibacter]|uniref:Co2+/Mg2+ efflux protein ApaG n=1 Tax=Sphingobacterium corticibacter TaxID=2171749 RepID=A0A2T8HK53_9SPHI|nr:Co2+/Mg2+ efflux protein ApaG [Sphingobacterium corticibacter]PVH25819.1 Co2+/Mg2+ efflux protein ApaG [Sphingobacterium corticibacter]
MISQITSDVRISVEAIYQPEYSNPDNLHFMFAYRITIENQSLDTIQLIRRHWDIFDTIGDHKQVDGEGVVGEQPILESGQIHQYASGCNLRSDMGYMQGFYEMQRLSDGELLAVAIPRFNLIADFRMN